MAGDQLRQTPGWPQLRQAPGWPPVDIHLQGPTMQVWDGEELLKTVLRTNGKEVRKKHAARAS